MRRIPPHTAPLCAAALLLASCGWGGRDAPGPQPPPAPLGVTAQAGSATSVHVMWNRVGSGSATIGGYEVYRGDTMVKDVPADQHMVDVTRLKPSTGYTFTVRARDAQGHSGPPSKAVSATTPAAVAADHRAPTRPGRLHGHAEGSRAASLWWGTSKDNRRVVSYDVYQGGTKIHSVAGTATRTVVTGLRPDTAYAFTVQARDAADNSSPPSGPLRLTTAPGTDDGRDTAPSDFRATTHRADRAYYIDLAWDPPETDGVIMQYEIQLNRRQVTTLVWGGTPPRGRATHSFFVDRKAGVSYRVRIRTMLPDGTWGAYSAERTVVTGETGTTGR